MGLVLTPPPAPAGLPARLTVNPATIDPVLSPLELLGTLDAHGIYVKDTLVLPAPTHDPTLAESADTEGAWVVANRPQGVTASVPLRVVEPAEDEATNHCFNPKGVFDTAHWTNVGLPTFEAVGLLDGPGPVQEAGADTGFHFAGDAANDRAYIDPPVIAGTSYRLSAYVYLVSLSANGARLVVRDDSNTIQATGVDLTELGVWTRLDVLVVASASANWRFSIEQHGAGAVEGYFTAVMIEAKPGLSFYFDGDSPGCEWLGARHGSRSHRPPPDGTRFWAIMDDVQQAVQRVFATRAGWLRYVPPRGTAITFELTDGRLAEWPQDRSLGMQRAEPTIEFDLRPYGRMDPLTFPSVSELAEPVLEYVVAGIPGSAPALGILEVTELAGKDQWWGAIGGGDDDSSNPVLIEAESLYIEGASTVQSRAGASGGDVLRSGPLADSWLDFCPIRRASGAYFTHSGTFQVLARIQQFGLNSGSQQVRLEWARGDLRSSTRNAPATIVAKTLSWQIVDLGVVRLDGSQWQGEISALSTVTGDKLEVDWIWLRQVDDVDAEVSVTAEDITAISLVASDAFNQNPPTGTVDLAGQSPDVGDAWTAVAGSDAHDFTANAFGGGIAYRQAIPDASLNAGRYVAIGATAYDLVEVQLDALANQTTSGWTDSYRVGVFCRLIDANNWLMAVRGVNVLVIGAETVRRAVIRIYKRVAGTVTLLDEVNAPSFPYDYARIRLRCDTQGRYQLRGSVPGAQPRLLSSGQDDDLAAGGALAAGKIGVYGAALDATTAVWIDNFRALVPDPNAVLFADKVLTHAWDGASRTDPDDNSGSVGQFTGKRLRLPCAGREGRTTRITTRFSRGFAGAPDTHLPADLSAQLTVIPRVLLTGRG